EHPATHRVAGCRSRPRAPVREVVGDPQPFVEDRPVETVLPLQFVTGPIEDCRWLAARQSVGHRAPLMLSPVDESHLGRCGKHLLIGEAVGWKVDSAEQAERRAWPPRRSVRHTLANRSYQRSYGCSLAESEA